MIGPRARGLGAVALLSGLMYTFGDTANAEDRVPKPNAVKIGLVGSLFRDLPEATLLVMIQPFAVLMRAQTGVSGELIPGGDVDQLGQQLATDKLQLVVFHGVEFAWAQQKHPELRPLCIAINQQRYLRAHLVVRCDSPATCWKDLQGKVLALPRQTREHCYMYLERQCQLFKKDPKAFFSRITSPANAEDGLDDIVDGVAHAIIVDGVALDCYKRRKPGRYLKLKDLYTSEIFPPAVVAYCPGFLDPVTIKSFRDGLVNANKTILGRQMLTMWQLSAFEMVPQDYDQVLSEITKIYPAPIKTNK